MSGLAVLFAALAVLGTLESVFGSLLVRRHFRRSRRATVRTPAISVLKPLKGDEPLLEDALASFAGQDYPEFEIVFGAADPADPALAVARRAAARFPDRDITFVAGRAVPAANRKVGNLLAMWPAARNDLIVIADQDVHAPKDLLIAIAAALDDPAIGLVSAPYAGVAGVPGLIGALGVSRITHDFLPATLVGRAAGRTDTLGAVMALRRETLEKIGGFAVLAGELADDAVLGQRVKALGFKVRLLDTLVRTTVTEGNLRALFRHELRWARTIRSLAPLGFAASALGYPLVFALLAVLAAGAAPWSVGLFVAVWLVRVVLARVIEQSLGLAGSLPAWAFPLRDLLSLTELLVSYTGNRVEWRGAVLRAGRPGSGTSAPVPHKGSPNR